MRIKRKVWNQNRPRERERERAALLRESKGWRGRRDGEREFRARDDGVTDCGLGARDCAVPHCHGVTAAVFCEPRERER